MADSGACLLLAVAANSADADAASTLVDVSPLGGRLVVFPSPLLPHEVLPVLTGGQARFAVTAWFHPRAPVTPQSPLRCLAPSLDGLFG